MNINIIAITIKGGYIAQQFSSWDSARQGVREMIKRDRLIRVFANDGSDTEEWVPSSFVSGETDAITQWHK